LDGGDGMVEGTGAVFEAKFMLPWSFSEEGAAGARFFSESSSLRTILSRSPRPE
jgi:hypothetical protein